MSSKQKQSGGPPETEWKHLLSVGSLVAAVLFTLVLGAALQAAPEPGEIVQPLPSSRPAIDPRPAPLEPPAERDSPVPAPGVGLTAGVDLVDLAARASADAARLSAMRGWTLQFMLACDPDNVRLQLQSLADDRDLYVLPAIHDGRSCFRVCWGRFATRDRAASVRRYPAALRAIEGQPHPLEIARAVP